MRDIGAEFPPLNERMDRERVESHHNWIPTSNMRLLPRICATTFHGKT
jgi:hypothetical protein